MGLEGSLSEEKATSRRLEEDILTYEAELMRLRSLALAEKTQRETFSIKLSETESALSQSKDQDKKSSIQIAELMENDGHPTILQDLGLRSPPHILFNAPKGSDQLRGKSIP